MASREYENARREGRWADEPSGDTAGNSAQAAGRRERDAPRAWASEHQRAASDQFGGYGPGDDTFGRGTGGSYGSTSGGRASGSQSYGYASQRDDRLAGEVRDRGGAENLPRGYDRPDWGSRGASPQGREPGRQDADRNQNQDPGHMGYQGHQREFDPDYYQWRSEQMRKLDRDYEQWRQERYQKFSEEFNRWRSQRDAPASSSSAASSQPEPRGRSSRSNSAGGGSAGASDERNSSSRAEGSGSRPLPDAGSASAFGSPPAGGGRREAGASPGEKSGNETQARSPSGSSGSGGILSSLLGGGDKNK
ncbi:MAG: hypothetical protein V4731_18005 [Pseudomonadota bacterium]